MRASPNQLLARTLAAAALTVSVAGGAQAASLGLTTSYPDILAGNIVRTYDPVTGVFSADGLAISITYAPAATPVPISDGTFKVSGTIDNATGDVSGTSLFLITGKIDVGPLQTLARGTIAKVGFDPTVAASKVLEFLVTPDPSEGLEEFKNANLIGVILSNTVVTANNWRADNFPIPEPASLALLATGLLLGGSAVRRRRNR